MPRVKSRSISSAPRSLAFAYVSDLTHAVDWVWGLRSFPVQPDSPGLGAVYEGSMQLGPKTLRSTIEVVEWSPDEAFATESRSGIRNRARWTFSDSGDGGTVVAACIEYELPGPAGRAVSSMIEPFVHLAVKHSESNLLAEIEKSHAAVLKGGTL